MKETLVNYLTVPRQIMLGIILVFAGFITVFMIANPMPPKTVTVATGPETGAYYAYGKRYQEFFAKRGIELTILQTKGAQENAELILDPDSNVDAAFMQSGIINANTTAKIETLGSIAYEPMWLFYRGADTDGTLQKLMDLSQRKINIGEKGSGTYDEALRLLSLNGLDKSPNLISAPTSQGVNDIIRGTIDGIFLIQGLQSANIQRLIADPNLKLANFVRAEAYAQRIPYLQRLTIPMGGLDLKRNFPEQKTQLIATTTELVVKEKLHPTIQMLFLQAAHEINGGESFFAKRNEFPAFKGGHLKESRQAALYYEKGTPFLMDYLPFWLAEFIHRTFFFFLPLIAIGLPIIRYLPELYDKHMRGRIGQVYSSLKALEKDITTSYGPEQQLVYLARLDQINETALTLKHSLDHVQEYYTLRTHIDHVRSCLEAGKVYKPH